MNVIHPPKCQNASKKRSILPSQSLQVVSINLLQLKHQQRIKSACIKSLHQTVNTYRQHEAHTSSTTLFIQRNHQFGVALASLLIRLKKDNCLDFKCVKDHTGDM